MANSCSRHFCCLKLCFEFAKEFCSARTWFEVAWGFFLLELSSSLLELEIFFRRLTQTHSKLKSDAQQNSNGPHAAFDKKCAEQNEFFFFIDSITCTGNQVSIPDNVNDKK